MSTYENKFIGVINNVIELFMDTISTAHKNGHTTLNSEMLKMAKVILSKKMDGIGAKGVMDNFIKKTNEHWEKIAEKDEKYFSKNLPDIVTDVPADYVKEFCKLFTGTKNGKSLIPEEDKDALFESIIELVKISLKYIYKNRNPVFKDGKFVEYKDKFYPTISLSKHSKLFGVKLN